MRKFKTSEKNRTNYIYYTADDKKIVIKPGMLDSEGKEVTVEMITILHTMDDEQVNADRRDEYHVQLHFGDEYDWLQRATNSPVNTDNSKLPRMADLDSVGKSHMADPLEQMLVSINEQEHTEKLHKLKTAITSLTELQQDIIYKKFYLGMTNVAIAEEAGVSEAAIRKRLKNIYEQLKNKL